MKENYSDEEWRMKKEKEMKLWMFYVLQFAFLVTIGSSTVFNFNERAGNFQLAIFFLTIAMMLTPFWKKNTAALLIGEGTLTGRGYRFFLNLLNAMLILFAISQSIYWIKYLYF